MSPRRWEDLVARVRGLGTRLAGRSTVLEWSRARDLTQLAAAVASAYADQPVEASPEALELMARRFAARLVRILARWSGDRRACLTPLFLDEDRRSVRALLRGVVARSPADQRLAGLIPTPSLPEKALETLAAQTTISGIVALLTAWSHPFGAPLLVEGRKPKPDLLRLDLTVNTQYAGLAAREARRAPLGSAIRGELTTYVAEMADLENSSTALQLASHQSSIDPSQLFLPGGRHLDRKQFLSVAGAADPARARSALSRTFRGTPLAHVFDPTSGEFEEAALAAQLHRATAAARLAPLGAAPVLAFWLRLRAQMRDLRFIIWHVALGAPRADASALLTPS